MCIKHALEKLLGSVWGVQHAIPADKHAVVEQLVGIRHVQHKVAIGTGPCCEHHKRNALATP